MIKKNDPRVLACRAEKNLAKRRRMSDALVRENQALVAKLVSKFAKWAPYSVDQDDLMQAGYIAFLWTLDNIDLSRTFSTYYAFRVWYEVSKICNTASMIYRPRDSTMPAKLAKQIERHMTREGRPPTVEEVFAFMHPARDPKPGEMDRLRAKLDLWAENNTPLSLDTPYGGEDGASQHELLPDSRPNPEQQMTAIEDKNVLSACIAQLPEGQRQVIKLMLEGCDDMEISERLVMPVAFVESTRDSAVKRLRTSLLG